MSDTRAHWDNVYATRAEDEVSWYQAELRRSLDLIATHAPDRATPIVDVGGGASRLVDGLIAAGYRDLTVLDVSAEAIARTKARLGSAADSVGWIVADVTRWTPERQWRLWHDRAVFHFLTGAHEQDAYLRALKQALPPGGTAILATFALDGPEKCSGLPVQRYSAASLARRLGDDFQLLSEAAERHVTPRGAVQSFTYAVFERR